MMLFVDIFLPALGLLMLIVGVLEKREAKRIRREVAESLLSQAMSQQIEGKKRFDEMKERVDARRRQLAGFPGKEAGK